MPVPPLTLPSATGIAGCQHMIFGHMLNIDVIQIFITGFRRDPQHPQLGFRIKGTNA
jgi:hypothetical protein